LALCLLAGIAALAVSYSWLGAPYITNDGYQYLDAASNVAAGKCLCTRLAHFDEQVAVGRMPIPLTHFPPGYPLLIATFSLLGLRSEMAGYLLSAAGFLITLWLIWDISCLLDARPWVAASFVFVWIGNEAALRYASIVLTESLFTAALMAMAALLVRDVRDDGRRPVLLLGIGALAGIAYSLRYAGIFLMPVAGLYIVWRWWRNRETVLWAVGGIALAGAFILPIQFHNLINIGSWRPRYISVTHHTLGEVAVLTVKTFYHLILGDRMVAKFNLGMGLLLISLLLVAGFALQAWRRKVWTSVPAFLPSALVWMSILVLAYVSGIIVAVFSSNLDDPRYYLPVYPLLLAGLAGSSAYIASRKLDLSIALMAVAIVVTNSHSLMIRPEPAAHLIVENRFQQEVQPGQSMGGWLRDHVTPADVLVAGDGQAVEYVLQRPVVSIIEAESTNRPTDEAAFRALMLQYGSRYLLLFQGMRAPYASPQDSITFLSRVQAGNRPDWLSLTAQTPSVSVYECSSCAK
jgi:hypothetical protein